MNPALKSSTVIFALLLFTQPVFCDDVKDALDRSIRHLRLLQNSDGSYGAEQDRVVTTSLALICYCTSPRRYTDLDGPFIRKATDWIVKQQVKDGALEGQGMDGSALAIAAVASGNRLTRPEFINRGVKFLKTTLPKSGPDLFYLYLANQFTKAAIQLSYSAQISEKTDPVFQSFWNPSDKVDLRSLVKKIEDALSAEPSSMAPTQIWAGVYLLYLKDHQGLAPEGWANQISKGLLSAINRIPLKEEMAKALKLTCALSLCHGKISEQKFTQSMQESKDPDFLPSPLPLKEAVSKAMTFLKSNQKNGLFGFSGFADPGITALTLSAVIRGSRLLGTPPPDYVESGLNYLKSIQKENGAIYQHGLANYVTSAAIMTFKDANDPKYASIIERAKNFLITLQCDEGEGYSLEEDPYYGGMGYGGDERPDLSNTQMSIEALRAAGLDKDHEAFSKAVKFLEKCQNLAEVNPTKVQINPKEKIISGNDGGGIYYPGNSKADLEDAGNGVFVARSYGSMTYALLKSYILGGVQPSDKRVQAAVSWISKNYTLEENPGFINKPGKDLGQQGLYYYFLTMARALNALNLDTIQSTKDKTHQWRIELNNKILSLQRVDGSWLNHRAPRWFEGNPVLATAYALLVLDECNK